MGDEEARKDGLRFTKTIVSTRKYRLCSFQCEVGSNDPRLLDLIDRFLVPFHANIQRSLPTHTYLLGSDESGAISLTADGEEILPKGPAAASVAHLLWELSRQAIGSVTGYLALHAGSLSWRGLGVVLPAPSGGGKSTLTAGLTAAGCGYLSDEVGLVDLESGILHPFPRPLWMTQGSIELLPGLRERLPSGLGGLDAQERHVPPDCLRPAPIGGPCPLRCVIVPEHFPGEQTVLEPIRRSEAVISMMTNAFNFDDFKGHGIIALARIAKQIRAYRLRMADLSTAVNLVFEALDGIEES